MLQRYFLFLLLALLALAGPRSAWAQSPVITGFSPASGAAGTSVVITGSGFTGAASVRFGEVSATFTLNSASQITAIVPRTASTQPLNVTLTGGSYAVSSAAFATTRSGSLAYGLVASNFAGVAGGTNAAPAVGDLNGNNLLDLLVGLADGTVVRYEQTAVNGLSFTNLGVLKDASNTTIDMGTQATVSIADFDGNGRFSVLLGRSDGLAYEYEQTAAGATTFALLNSSFGNIATTGNSTTCVTSLTGDGYLGVLTGKSDGSLGYFGQAPISTGNFYRITSNFNNIQLTTNSAPFCIDLDGNGLLDMLVGLAGGTLYRYEQSSAGAATMTQLSSNFSGIAGGANAKPCVTDIDGDGLLDLLVGRADGTIDRYEQTLPNVAPTDISLSPSAVDENQPVGTTVGTLSSIDPNAGNTFTYTFAAGGADNGSFTISGSTLTTNGVFDYETKNSYTIKVRSTDQGGLFVEKTLTVSVNNVNEAPVVTVPATQTSAPNTAKVFSTANGNAISISDVDAGSGSLSVYMQITQGTATLSTTSGLTFSQGTGTGNASMSFTGTLASINAALNGLSFSPNANFTGAAAVQVQVNDQGNSGSGGALSDSKTVTINVVNSPPVLTVSSGSTTWAQGGGAVAVDAALTATDADSPSLASATVSISGNFQSGQDVLGFANANGIAGSYNTTSGVLTLSGAASVASYQAALRSITYTNTSATPNVGSRTVSFVANDGFASSPAVSKTVALVAQPNTTIVSGPGAITNNSTVHFEFSSDQSPVDYTTTGAPSFAYTGNGYNPNFGPVPDGSYTLSAAAHNTSSGLTDPTPATYSFTVDTQKPVPTISSSGNTNGGSTTASAIPFTVTFSENVTGFVAGGVGVSNGMLSGFTAVSGTTYTFTVTPTTPNTATTVSVAAGVAQDAATNPNVAATSFSVTYVVAGPNLTSLNPSTAAIGASIVITGTSLTGATAVRFNYNSLPASTFTVNSATQITVAVPVGTTNGNVAVTTPGGTSNGLAFTVAAPNTTIVSGPGAITKNNIVHFEFSSDQSPVDYTTTGAPSFAYTGNGASSNFGPVPDGSYTLSVAAHNTNTNLTDATPATYNFIVDTTRPVPTISSSVGASGSSTGSAPIPFTVTFSEPVTGFSSAGVSVGNGSLTAGSFTAVSATTYTFTVAPAASGAVTVGVAASVAQDAATNGNTAASQFSIAYAPAAPSITSLSPDSGPAGSTVIIAGQNLTGTTAVRFSYNNTPATFTVDSPTQLTVTVPAAATTGNVQLSTPGGTSNGLAFTVTVLSVQVPANGTYLTGQSLNFTVNYPAAVTVNTSSGTPTLPITIGSTARQAAYVSGSGSPALVFRYTVVSGDLDTDGIALASALALNGGTLLHAGGTVAPVVLNEVPTTSGVLVGTAPLPVQLVSFTAEAKASAVQLTWRTASEQNTARFEIERSPDGQQFTRLGEVAAQGTKASASDYTFVDAKPGSGPATRYYRLRQVDLDGTFSYSPTRSVALSGPASLALFPNPTTGAATLTGAEAGTPVLVLDALGRTVATSTTNASGQAALVLPPGLATGIYLVRAGAMTLHLMVK